MYFLLKDSVDEQMLLLGNEAIARGALEAGVAFTTAYPGTPSSEIALQFFQISRESDLYFEYSANEKVALEVAAGAAMCGLRTMVTMKHVGLNVASDALMKIAVQKGRSQKPNLECGICGEHGGDPMSIDLCHQLGLTYVSCSPYRVPIARLAAAHAALKG